MRQAFIRDARRDGAASITKAPNRRRSRPSMPTGQPIARESLTTGCRAAAASPFPDDPSPTPKRASSTRGDAFWADPQHQALTQEDDVNEDPIPSAG
jgi:hypothetical protein